MVHALAAGRLLRDVDRILAEVETFPEIIHGNASELYT